MEEALMQLGLNQKEAKLYLYLLQNGSQTALQAAKGLDEKRTNTYMLLDSLTEKGIVSANNDGGARHFAAGDPNSLKSLLEAEQQRQARASAALRVALPQLRSLYTLANNKPGVIHLAGIEGYLAMLDDSHRSTTDILVMASDEAPTDPETFELLKGRLYARKDAGIATRALFHHNGKEEQMLHDFRDRGTDLRFMGTRPFNGEVAIYEDNVVFTVYKPSLVTTIVTNSRIADTMRYMFDELWDKGDKA
jgi:sugar-specific transcriptional regulator TrmB